MKTFIKKLLIESLTKSKVKYIFEHLDSYNGQDNWELGMYINGDIIGMVQYTTFENEITISDIIVRPEFRRKGFGSRMVQAMKNKHPEYNYVPSMKTDLGAKFKHKEIKDINSLDENILKTYNGHKIPVGQIFPNDNVHNSSKGPNWELMRKIDVYQDDKSFEQNPVERISINKIVPTQKFVSKDNLEDVKGIGNNTGAYLVKYNNLYYIIDGHHRIVTRILDGDKEITAFVHTIESDINESFNIDNIDKSQFIKFISDRNNLKISEVSEKFKNTKFIKLYRSEGKVADRSKLPKSVSNTSGTWFTPHYNEMVRYNKMNPDRNGYHLDVPEIFYNNLRSGNKHEISKGEVQLPIELARLKKILP